MRKLFATLLFLALATSMIAINKKVITLSFDPKEYPVTLDKQGAATFSSAVRPLIFKEEPHMPGIPYVPVTILLASNEHYKAVSYTTQDYTLFENALVYDNPMPVPTNGEAKEAEHTISYPAGMYPAENIEFTGEGAMDGYKLLRFMVCPYSFDSEKGVLTLKKSISLTLELEGEEAQVMGGRNMRDVVSSIVENPEDLEALYLAPSNNIDDRTSQCRYLIITSQSLASSFETLAQWKTTKGLSAEIITTSAINRNYEGVDLQEKIKNCIKYYYEEKGLEYVLLGGDDTVVPVRGCYGQINYNNTIATDTIIPTDLYYACLDGNLQWKTDSDQYYGLVNNMRNGELNINVTVARLPVDTSDNTLIAVNKIIAYEKNPRLNSAQGHYMLICAANSSINEPTINMANSLYRFANPIVNNVSKYYDGGDEDFTVEKLSQKLSTGYNFVSIFDHGNQTCFMMKNRVFRYFDWSTLTNTHNSIITTIACTTNAFDVDTLNTQEDISSEVCVSESFIRGANNGVVAYLGCSRKGWAIESVTGSTDISRFGASFDYEKMYYEQLFSHNICNFGKIVDAVKGVFTTSIVNHESSYRWVHFGLNPIGDPEMYIYTDTPHNLDVTWSPLFHQDNVSFDTSIDSCTVCIMSLGDDGQSYYRVIENSTNTHFSFTNIPADSVQICITKPGFIPRIYKRILIPLSRETITYEYVNPTTITVRVNVPASATQAYVQASNLSGTNVRRVDLPIIGGEQTVTLTGLRAGVNVITYVVDGVVQDTIQIFI